MMTNKLGRKSIRFPSKPIITAVASIAGPKEGQGFFGSEFDAVLPDNINGQDSWEKCESYMMNWAINAVLAKRVMNPQQVDAVLAGDLLNQLTASHFALRGLDVPFLGLYGACSTMAEALMLGATLVDGGYTQNAIAVVSSHHEAAERQYRAPNEAGVQRPPSATWTVTGSGAALLESKGAGPYVSMATIGRVVDMGIKDPNNMGAAMAPAAADTICSHFSDTGRTGADYDRIFTGDCGSVGKELVIRLLRDQGVDIAENYEDCGCMIYRASQDAHAGASGCASLAVTFCSHIYRQMMAQKWHKVLLVGTGALHSPTSYQQKESIPCIAHAVAIEI